MTQKKALICPECPKSGIGICDRCREMLSRSSDPGLMALVQGNAAEVLAALQTALGDLSSQIPNGGDSGGTTN